MQKKLKERYIKFCKTIDDATVDQPFMNDRNTFIVRHRNTGKWFAAFIDHNGESFVNLKCKPIDGDFLRMNFQGVKPAYHMNKTHWISVHFNSDVDDEMMKVLIMESYNLTNKKT